MKKKESFIIRAYNVMVSATAKLNEEDCTKYPCGIYLRAQTKLRAFEGVTYTEYDLRGLSKAEKEFMRDNDMRVYYDYEGKRYYLFIQRNMTTGKPQLYAWEKRQWLNLNGHDVGPYWNYAYWLLVDTKRYSISKFYYEFRFCGSSVLPCIL